MPGLVVRDYFRHQLAGDYERETSFLAVALASGNYTFRTLGGEADQTEMFTEGNWIGPRPDTPVALVAVRGTSHGPIHVALP